MMLEKILLHFAAGLLIGYLLEFVYRSIISKTIVKPLFINAQMYGLSAVFLYLLYPVVMLFALKVILILVFTSGIEFAIGYGYLRFKGVRLWSYSEFRFNCKGFICPQFSLIWLALSLLYYCLVLPSLS